MRSLLPILLLASTPAWAGSTVTIDSIEVDGQALRALTCELTSGGFLASVQVTAAIAAQRTAFDACKPSGAAFRAEWTWAGGATQGVAVAASSAPDADACVKKALEGVSSSLSGKCTATVLVGERTVAEAAAAALPPAPKP